MSRSTQFIGLNDRAINWLKRYAVRISESKSDRKRFVQCDCGEILTGMFGEDVYTPQKYYLKGGGYVKEVLQCDPWSGGPMLFLCLEFPDGKIVRASYWKDEEIDKYL